MKDPVDFYTLYKRLNEAGLRINLFQRNVGRDDYWQANLHTGTNSFRIGYGRSPVLAMLDATKEAGDLKGERFIKKKRKRVKLGEPVKKAVSNGKSKRIRL